jgi:hypothetical protein
VRSLKTVLVGVVAVIAVATILFVGAGCLGTTTDQIGTYKQYVTHTDVDGKQVACIVIRTSHGSVSMSCDWGK